MIAVIDYGVGNLGSIANMLKRVGARAVVTSDRGEIERAPKLILPGVGAFDVAMRNLSSLGLPELLHERVIVKHTPILGICLGMQLMTEGSEEGEEAGLGWIPGHTHRFEFARSDRLKVPHMGWNVVNPMKSSPLLQSESEPARFYFVHSYYVRCRNSGDVLLRAHHGVDFDAGFERGNIMGVQFHPEKSHKFGMSLLDNFARLPG